MKRIELSNALKIDRPELGDEVGIGLYRLLRLVAWEDILGPGASAISYYAGKNLGKELQIKTLEDFLDLCKQLKIGIIKVPEKTDTHMHIDIYECVTCSGMEPVGRPICHFEGGLIAGAVEAITGKKVLAKEVTCIGGLGDATCGYDLTLKDLPKQTQDTTATLPGQTNHTRMQESPKK
jgi:predicted hydrocarbon binding protein